MNVRIKNMKSKQPAFIHIQQATVKLLVNMLIYKLLFVYAKFAA